MRQDGPLLDDRWKQFADSARALSPAWFSPGPPIWAARAPGRLDVMGGIADYSGSRVLEMPLSDAAYCAAQRVDEAVVTVRSANAASLRFGPEVSADTGDLAAGRARFDSPDSRWAAYVLGAIPILASEGLIPRQMEGGFRFYVESDVPVGAGVSSSAALEVAAMTALCALLGVEADGMRLARMCQRVENEIAGAPCGIMDQMTSALGKENRLLELECRPHTVLGHVPIPPGWRFIGLDSGLKHSVGGGAYTRARVSAFMGLRIVEKLLHRTLGGYLCSLSSEEWKVIRQGVPDAMTGGDYLTQYGDYPDSATTVDSAALYFPRAAAEHPILENERVGRFAELLRLGDSSAAEEAGKLMLESHRSYSDRARLGAEETDLLARLAMERGAESGIFGAKITGGGSGGTVAILCAGEAAEQAIEEIRSEYAAQTGIIPGVQAGSSPGAVAFGARRIA